MKRYEVPSLSQTLPRLERDARLLRAEHASDLMVRLAIAVDLQVRRMAYYVANRLTTRGRALTSTH